MCCFWQSQLAQLWGQMSMRLCPKCCSRLRISTQSLLPMTAHLIWLIPSLVGWKLQFCPILSTRASFRAHCLSHVWLGFLTILLQWLVVKWKTRYRFLRALRLALRLQSQIGGCQQSILPQGWSFQLVHWLWITAWNGESLSEARASQFARQRISCLLHRKRSTDLGVSLLIQLRVKWARTRKSAETRNLDSLWSLANPLARRMSRFLARLRSVFGRESLH